MVAAERNQSPRTNAFDSTHAQTLFLPPSAASDPITFSYNLFRHNVRKQASSVIL